MYISSSFLALNPLKVAAEIFTVTIFSTTHESNPLHLDTEPYILRSEAAAAVYIQEGGKRI